MEREVCQEGFKWGHKFIAGPFPDCECDSHWDSGYYPAEDFDNNLAFTTDEANEILAIGMNNFMKFRRGTGVIQRKRFSSEDFKRNSY